MRAFRPAFDGFGFNSEWSPSRRQMFRMHQILASAAPQVAKDLAQYGANYQAALREAQVAANDLSAQCDRSAALAYTAQDLYQQNWVSPHGVHASDWPEISPQGRSMADYLWGRQEAYLKANAFTLLRAVVLARWPRPLNCPTTRQCLNALQPASIPGRAVTLISQNSYRVVLVYGVSQRLGGTTLQVYDPLSPGQGYSVQVTLVSGGQVQVTSNLPGAGRFTDFFCSTYHAWTPQKSVAVVKSSINRHGPLYNCVAVVRNLSCKRTAPLTLRCGPFAWPQPNGIAPGQAVQLQFPGSSVHVFADFSDPTAGWRVIPIA